MCSRPSREPDRELIEADTDPERDGPPAPHLRELGESLVVFVCGAQGVDPERDQHADRDVVGCCTDRVPERCAKREPDHRHPGFEAGEQQ
jgi:hypothetical protein